jgi:excisionase family DNA binding protein
MTTTTNPAPITSTDPPDQLLTPAEVAALFRVRPRTVTRWAKAGRLACVRTLGGHRRYPAGQVHALLTLSAGRTEASR